MAKGLKNEEIVKEEGTQSIENLEPTIKLSEVQKMIADALAENNQKIAQETPKQSIPQQEVQRKDNPDDIPGLENFEYKDRRYVSLDYKKAESYGIRNKHRSGSPLQWTNSVTRKVYSLRYAENQSSFFTETQSGDVLLSYINMKHGMLYVPKENVTLQKFLAIHPDNGLVFQELDPEVENKKELDKEMEMFKAMQIANELSLLKASALARLLCPTTYTDEWDSGTVKLEIFRKSKENPTNFIKLAQDPTLELKGVISLAKHRNYIAFKNKNWYDSDNNLIVVVNQNENEMDAMVSFLKSNKGSDLYEYLKTAIS